MASVWIVKYFDNVDVAMDIIMSKQLKTICSIIFLQIKILYLLFLDITYQIVVSSTLKNPLFKMVDSSFMFTSKTKFSWSIKSYDIVKFSNSN